MWTTYFPRGQSSTRATILHRGNDGDEHSIALQEHQSWMSGTRRDFWTGRLSILPSRAPSIHRSSVRLKAWHPRTNSTGQHTSRHRSGYKVLQSPNAKFAAVWHGPFSALSALVATWRSSDYAVNGKHKVSGTCCDINRSGGLTIVHRLIPQQSYAHAYPL